MKELFIDLRHDSKRALYEQIYDYISKEIADGKISHGEKLPSTRFMAKNLQISRSTVEAAYEQLVAEGYLQTRPCAGYFVCDISELYRFRERTKPEQQERTQDKDERERHRGQVCFSPFEIDREHFPYQTWQRLRRGIAPQDDAKFFYAGDSRGDIDLREAVCGYLHRARGVNCDAGQLVVGAGNEYLLLLLSQLLSGRHTVAMEPYTYTQAAQTFLNMGYHIRAAETDESGMIAEELERTGADIVYVMPSHQFPLGTVMPMKRRLALLQWASEKEGRYIIEDDHDSEYRYRGKPIPSLQGLDTKGKVIYLGTFSKSIAPSVRVSYMALPQELLEVYHKNCGFYATTVPRTHQELLYRFLSDGSFERHLNRMRKIYKAKRDAMLGCLRNEDWVKRIHGEDAGLHMLVELDRAVEEKAFLRQAAEGGVELSGLQDYRLPGLAQGGEPPTLLMGYGALNETEMEKGLAVIRDILHKEH